MPQMAYCTPAELYAAGDIFIADEEGRKNFRLGLHGFVRKYHAEIVTHKIADPG